MTLKVDFRKDFFHIFESASDHNAVLWAALYFCMAKIGKSTSFSQLYAYNMTLKRPRFFMCSVLHEKHATSQLFNFRAEDFVIIATSFPH